MIFLGINSNYKSPYGNKSLSKRYEAKYNEVISGNNSVDLFKVRNKKNNLGKIIAGAAVAAAGIFALTKGKPVVQGVFNNIKNNFASYTKTTEGGFTNFAKTAGEKAGNAAKNVGSILGSCAKHAGGFISNALKHLPHVKK